MSNYYYDEKASYLRVLSETRAGGHDLTPFLLFGLRGIRQQCEALTAEIRKQMQRALFRDTMYSLFNRLRTERKRVIGARQVEILKILLGEESILESELFARTKPFYASIKGDTDAYVRDIVQLKSLGAISLMRLSPGSPGAVITINLDWPQEIDEGEFLRRMKTLPKGKTFKFLS